MSIHYVGNIDCSSCERHSMFLRGLSVQSMCQKGGDILHQLHLNASLLLCVSESVYIYIYLFTVDPLNSNRIPVLGWSFAFRVFVLLALISMLVWEGSIALAFPVAYLAGQGGLS